MAALVPIVGSVKQTWNTVVLPLVTSREEAEGVIMSMSSAISPETATAAPVVTGPTSACMPQSHRVLKAVTAFSPSATSSSLLISKVMSLVEKSLTASSAPFLAKMP